MKFFTLAILILLTATVHAQNDTNRRRSEYEKTVFILDKPFNQPDTLMKVKILTGTTSIQVVNGYALVERREWGWLCLPPFQVDGWQSVHWYDRTYRIVRVKEIQDAGKVVMDMSMVWGYKFLNW